MLLLGLRPCGIIFMNTVDMVMLRDFWFYGLIFVNLCYKRCHGNVVKRIWALWDNIYGYMFIALYFPVILDG
jgi:hypothetical protein